MSETDLARSWWAILPRGGELEPMEKEGRAPVTELSARVLSCSDQLKPCWSARELGLSEGALGCLVLLAWDKDWEARRPAADRAAEMLEPCACCPFCPLGLRVG